MTSRKHWVLDANGEPVETDLLTWALWMETDDRVLWRDCDEQTGWRVSTIFLGIDHNFSLEKGPPVLWETMVFGGPLSGEGERYTSKADAREGHRRMCAKVMEVLAAGRPVTTD
jgi:hypothetical protein